MNHQSCDNSRRKNDAPNHSATLPTEFFEMLCGFMALYSYQGPLAPGLNFVKNSLTYFYSLFISSSALHLIAERLASVTAYTSFKVFGLTRLRVEPSLPASKANALNH